MKDPNEVDYGKFVAVSSMAGLGFVLAGLAMSGVLVNLKTTLNMYSFQNRTISVIRINAVNVISVHGWYVIGCT
jgi:hypothetical protein